MNERDRQDRDKLPTHYSLSVIVPAFNEVDNIAPLAREFDNFLSKQHFRAEVIVIDDGSTDGTGDKVLELSERYGFLKLVRHKQNLGKTAAIESGFAVSNGKRICIFDADLQYDPRDIKRMMDKLDRGFGIVSGIKKGKYQKPLVSKIYNAMTSRLFGLKVKDMNSLKLVRRDVMANLFMRKDWHRFMVVLAAERGYKIAEIPVTLRPRKHGKPKYGGPGRLFVGMTDLVAVWLSERVFCKPMLIFGSFGFVSLGLAVLLALFIIIMRLAFDYGYPPLQTIIVLLVSLGGFALTLGFLAEAIANLRDRVEFLMSRMGTRQQPRVETAKTSRPTKREYTRKKPQPADHKRESKPRPDRYKRDKKKKTPPKQDPEPKSRDNRPEPKAIEKKPEEPLAKTSSDSIEIIQPTEEPSWGRRGRRTKSTVIKGAEDTEAFKRVEEKAKEVDNNASLGFTGEKPGNKNG